MRCMRARRRDLCSGGGGESGGGGGGGVPMGGGESDAEAPAPSALIVAEVRGCYLPMPPAPVARPCHLLLSPAPVACPCHLPPPQVTLRLHTGRTHQLRAQVSHPRPAPARPQPAFSLAPARLQPAFSPPSARCAPCLWPTAHVHLQATPACLCGSWVSSATPCSATRCTARGRWRSCASCAASTPHRRGRSLHSLWHGCRRGPSRCTLGSSGLREGRPSPRIQAQVVIVEVVVMAMVGVVVR